MRKKLFYFITIFILSFNCHANIQYYPESYALWVKPIKPQSWFYTHGLVKTEHGWSVIDPWAIISVYQNDVVHLLVLTKFSNGMPIPLDSSCKITIHEKGDHLLTFQMLHDNLIHCRFEPYKPSDALV